MQTSKRDELRSQTGAREVPNSEYSELVERYPVDIFMVVGNPDKGYFVGLGQFRLTEPAGKQETEDKIKNRDWELIMNLMMAVGAVAVKEPSVMEYDKREEYTVKED